MPKEKELYRATREGCVIETKGGSVVYEKLEGIPADAIAEAMNYFRAQGIDANWKLVEERLVETGVLEEARS